MSTLALLHPQWPAPKSVRAVCTLRAGGVSVGPYASLNLSAAVGDDAAAVSDNRRRVRDELALRSEPLWLQQVHGIRVADADVISDSNRSSVPPQADGAITRVPGRVLAVQVADCMPVLLARRDGRAIAVAHAGWRGLAAGVLEAAIAALGGAQASVLAWLGPAIGLEHFEVGDEVRLAFCEREARAAAAFRHNARGRWQCDLHQLARQRLETAGVVSIHGERRCTFSECDSFYSFRRDGVTGRIAALIWMEPA
jgi:YfiH family protein